MTEQNLKQLADLHDENIRLKEQMKWIDASEKLPPLIEGEDYSENVLAMVEGYENIQVMCLCWIFNEGEQSGYAWANCYGKIDGDAEFDDNYIVTHWIPLPEPPKQYN